VIIPTRALAVGLALAVAAAARGQPPAPPPAPDAGMSRAYLHFLQSPASVRTYSGTRPGAAWGAATPFGYAESYVEPGWVRHRIGPRGFEAEEYVSGIGARRVTPWSAASFAVPGHVLRSTAPPAAATPAPPAAAPEPPPLWSWDGREWRYSGR
jgi:hypothetical protein